MRCRGVFWPFTGYTVQPDEEDEVTAAVLAFRSLPLERFIHSIDEERAPVSAAKGTRKHIPISIIRDPF